MNKETVIRLIKRSPIKPEELTQFILDCIKFKGKSEPTSGQLIKIIELFKVGAFNFDLILPELIAHFKLQVNTVVSNNQIIRIDVYE